MAKRIKAYLKYMEELLKREDLEFDEEIKRHLIQIEFFQHERMIHLIVTVTFAIITIITILYAIAFPSMSLFCLVAALMVLLVPYIKHYYLLENSVQKMYEQYDQLIIKKDNK